MHADTFWRSESREGIAPASLECDLNVSACKRASRPASSLPMRGGFCAAVRLLIFGLAVDTRRPSSAPNADDTSSSNSSPNVQRRFET
eukprot:6207922-Pleurochrysis_carterae.AAC.4